MFRRVHHLKTRPFLHLARRPILHLVTQPPPHPRQKVVAHQPPHWLHQPHLRALDPEEFLCLRLMERHRAHRPELRQERCPWWILR